MSTLHNPSKSQGGRSQLAFMKLIERNKNLNTHRGPVTLSELANHTHPYDCWIALEGFVFNVTPYLEYHPGGADEILTHAGTDATDAYMRIHPWVNYRAILEPLLVGKLVDWVSGSKAHGKEPVAVVKYTTQFTEEFRPHRIGTSQQQQPAVDSGAPVTTDATIAGPDAGAAVGTGEGEIQSWLSKLLGFFKH